MSDIDNVLGSKYFNAVDTIGAVAQAVGKTADALKKPDLGKLISQKCGRKGLGFVFNKSKRDAFKKCADETTNDWNKQYNTTATTILSGEDVTKSLNEQQASNTNKILIGLGIVVVGFFGYIAIKK